MSVSLNLRSALTVSIVVSLAGCATPSAYTYVSSEEMDASWRNVSCSRAETDAQRALCQSEHAKAGLPAELPGDKTADKSTVFTPEQNAQIESNILSEPAKPEKPTQAEALQRAQAVMAAILKDPYSAHWDCKEMQWE